MVTYYAFSNASEIIAVMTGMPEQPVRVGVGRTPRIALAELAPTPIQSTGPDCGEAAGLDWACRNWLDCTTDDLREIDVDDDEDLDDTASAWHLA